MYPTKPGNTQVYSPFGSFVVEQHDETRRHDIIRQRYEHATFGWEKGIAIAWTLLITGFLVGSIYNRLGRPELAATSAAEASIKGAASSTAAPVNE